MPDACGAPGTHTGLHDRFTGYVLLIIYRFYSRFIRICASDEEYVYFLIGAHLHSRGGVRPVRGL